MQHWFAENVLCLLSNAVKYSNGGTINVIIELVEPDIQEYMDGSTEKASPQLLNARNFSSFSNVSSEDPSTFPSTLPSIRVSIEDTGIGLSVESRKVLFQPFKQVQRMAGGTGLGLFSLSKRMESLGGSRGVAPRRDGLQGSNFWFSFPYRPDHSHEVNTQISDECVDNPVVIQGASYKGGVQEASDMGGSYRESSGKGDSILCNKSFRKVSFTKVYICIFTNI
jgi:hypothetical protein